MCDPNTPVFVCFDLLGRMLRGHPERRVDRAPCCPLARALLRRSPSERSPVWPCSLACRPLRRPAGLQCRSKLAWGLGYYSHLFSTQAPTGSNTSKPRCDTRGTRLFWPRRGVHAPLSPEGPAAGGRRPSSPVGHPPTGMRLWGWRPWPVSQCTCFGVGRSPLLGVTGWAHS